MGFLKKDERPIPKEGFKKHYESQVRDEIWKWLLSRDVRSWRNKVTRANHQIVNGSFKETNRVSDIIGILKDGRLLAVEVRKMGQYLRRTKREFIEDISARGGVAIVAASLEEAKDLLRGYVK